MNYVERELLEKAKALRGTGPITPEHFAERMRLISKVYGGDSECLHGAADELMEETLDSLGYSEGLEVQSAFERWYA